MLQCIPSAVCYVNKLSFVIEESNSSIQKTVFSSQNSQLHVHTNKINKNRSLKVVELVKQFREDILDEKMDAMKGNKTLIISIHESA